MSEREILQNAYRDFNARNIEAVISRMHPKWSGRTEWKAATSMEKMQCATTGHANSPPSIPTSSRVHIDPAKTEAGWSQVHQVVHDHNGNLLLDTTVYHTYQFRDGLIARMDIAHEDAQTGQNQ